MTIMRCLFGRCSCGIPTSSYAIDLTTRRKSKPICATCFCVRLNYTTSVQLADVIKGAS